MNASLSHRTDEDAQGESVEPLGVYSFELLMIINPSFQERGTLYGTNPIMCVITSG